VIAIVGVAFFVAVGKSEVRFTSCTMLIIKMGHLSSPHVVAGAIGILCFLALASVLTVEELTNNEEEETDDSEDEESGVPGAGFLNLWLYCFLAIVVILMRLVRDDNNLLYRALLGLLSLMTILAIAQRIAENNNDGYIMGTDIIVLWYFLYELCRHHSPLAASACYCTAQMWFLCAFLYLALLLLMINVIFLEPFDAFDWISLVILVTCTVSSFVVASLAPPITHVAAQEEPSDAFGTEFELM
jgi:hypothetical protein